MIKKKGIKTDAPVATSRLNTIKQRSHAVEYLNFVKEIERDKEHPYIEAGMITTHQIKVTVLFGCAFTKDRSFLCLKVKSLWQL